MTEQLLPGSNDSPSFEALVERAIPEAADYVGRDRVARAIVERVLSAAGVPELLEARAEADRLRAAIESWLAVYESRATSAGALVGQAVRRLRAALEDE